jgi:hypothetical protein
MSGVGVPEGRRWYIMNFVLLIHPKYIIVIHKMVAVENEIEMWAVDVKIKGHRANKFLTIIIMNSDFMKIKFPWKFLFENKVFTSFEIMELILFIMMIHLIVILDLMGIIIKRGNSVAVQDRFIIDDDGSKIENKFVIMFN